MKNKCFHLVGRHCSFYSAKCGPRDKMACGYGVYKLIPYIAVALVIWGLAIIYVWSDDKQAEYDNEKATALARRIGALEEEFRKERLYMEHRLDAMDNTAVKRWKWYERLHKHKGGE